jgi:hypothetical protein
MVADAANSVACSRYGSRVVRAVTGTNAGEQGAIGGRGRKRCELAQPRIGDPNQTGSSDQDRIEIEVRVAASGTCSGLRRKQRDEPS